MEWFYWTVAFVCIFGSSYKIVAEVVPEQVNTSINDDVDDDLLIPISPRIVGGDDATDNFAPYQCSLQLSSGLLCGCSIISSEWILTAAHCFILEAFNITAPEIEIVVGTNEWQTGGTRYNASEIIVHENFELSDYINDIALIHTQSPIEFSERVQPINFTSNVVQPDTPLQTTGWGMLKENGPRSDKLQVLYLRSISNEECQSKSEDYVDESHLCTLSPKMQGMCGGDSGGPLVDPDTNELVGVTSWSVPCGRGKPEGYAKISQLYNWIVEKIKSP